MPDEITIKDYIDTKLASIDKEFKQRFEDHRDVHAREREAVFDFKRETEQWRIAANEFRAQLTLERSNYIQRKEIWSMLAATGGIVITVITILYFITSIIHTGHIPNS
jgi:hypothetical protein